MTPALIWLVVAIVLMAAEVVSPSLSVEWSWRLPARTRIQAGRTPMDCGLEVEAIGYVPRKLVHRSAPGRRRKARPSARRK